MENPLISILPGPEEAATEAAGYLLDILLRAVEMRGCSRLVLAGGSTPRRLYALLAAEPFRARFLGARTHLFWTDERAVGTDHAESNYRMAHETFLQKMDIPEGNIHRMRGEALDLDQAARDYETEIRQHFKLTSDASPPSFDLVLLGLGVDGHTASLFPRTTALQETVRWVVPHRTTLDRITLTLPILNQAERILFLVCGEEKANILAELFLGRSDAVPAGRIRPVIGSVRWIMDRAAARRLQVGGVQC